ncbi:MAG: hypothetical protein HYW25_02765 [Candidatus Aenigmarchaeota archaeon]|nr:hypothetical protein [Candidatus Aenigmarchaeota archaeon]
MEPERNEPTGFLYKVCLFLSRDQEPHSYKAPDFKTISAWRERVAEWEKAHGRWDLHPLGYHYFWICAWEDARERYEAAYPNDTLEAARRGRQAEKQG